MAPRHSLPGTPTITTVMLAFGLAWLAHAAGSEVILGAFAASLLLGGTAQAREVERGVAYLGILFVPLFFVSVGDGVDLCTLSTAGWRTLLVCALLTLTALASKFVAGYAPFLFKGRKSVIGFDMVTRGDVGLIFAQAGLAAGIFNVGLYSTVTLMAGVMTFLAPPLLKVLFQTRDPGRDPPVADDSEDLVTEA